jgi:hypothetical protein
MKRTLVLLAFAGTLLLGACTSDSKLPTPTGKGAVRAINAIKGSPETGFLIEERSLGGIRYQDSSSPVEYDDFSYNFNFEIAYPGDTSFTRVATQALQIEADRDHILVLTGDINAPTILVWNGDMRSFTDTDTVLEARFAHANPDFAQDNIENIDVYFDPPGTPPGTNPPAATLAFGEISAPVDFAEGPYVLTIFAQGDLITPLFTSRETTLLPRFAHVFTVFEGDANDTAPVHVRSMTSIGNPLSLTDADYPPQVRFVHGASTLEPVDIYEDDLLTNLVVAGLDFKGASAWLDTDVEAKTYYFTPANSTATILFEQPILAPAPGSFAQIYAIGDTDAWSAVGVVPNLAPTSTSARIRMFHAALNHESFDAYIKDRDEPLLEDDTPTLLNTAYGFVTPIINIPAGNVDLYVTVRGEKTVIAGPYQIDATLGSNIELLLVDTVDPLTAELVDITPTP